MNKQQLNKGKVFLVGAGPGNKDLLTLRALKIIEECDVILFDNLVSEEIRDLFPKGTKKVFVGKQKNHHSLSQDEINLLLKRLALKGHRVCRLKGGDPFVFGRGSEEMLVLKSAFIDVEVVPGVSAAIGCGAYSGIPLTHRSISQGCTFVTGHAAKSLDIDWSALARLDHTIVFYMGLSQAKIIKDNLLNAGMSPTVPCALIEKGTLNSQQTITTSLSQLENAAEHSGLGSPTLILVGHVVDLHAQLSWFKPDSNAEWDQDDSECYSIPVQQMMA